MKDGQSELISAGQNFLGDSSLTLKGALEHCTSVHILPSSWQSVGAHLIAWKKWGKIGRKEEMKTIKEGTQQKVTRLVTELKTLHEKRVGLKSSHHNINNYNHMWRRMLTKLVVVIISQYIHIFNHQAVYLKLIQCYISIVPQF